MVRATGRARRAPAAGPQVPIVVTVDGQDLELRRASPSDWPAVLDLLEQAMGWTPDDHHDSFLAWKHRENVFGPSPGWVALDGARVVGFRTFLRWEFTEGGATRRAVRAVDTATHPTYRGRGVFSRLTLLALEDLREEGVAFVFNTPNDQSRPGYLKMGWSVVGRLPIRFRPRSLSSLASMARAGVAAGKWSEPTSVGEPAPDVLSDSAAVERLLHVLEAPQGICTRRSPGFLAWRYGFGPLAYRALVLRSNLEDGLLLFRLRRRGPALELSVCDLLVPGEQRAIVRRALSELLRKTGADYLLRMGSGGADGAGTLPVPGRGPTLLWRGLVDSSPPPPARWRLGLGDVELL